MSGDYFIVAGGNDAYVCKKYDAAQGDTYYGGFAKYSLSGPSPSYNTATLQGMYTNSSDLPKFELEAISSNSAGQKYVVADAKYKDEATGKNKDCDAIYKVYLH